MKKEAKRGLGDLRPEYDLSQLKGGVRGKYHRNATARTKLHPDRTRAAEPEGTRKRPAPRFKKEV